MPLLAIAIATALVACDAPPPSASNAVAPAAPTVAPAQDAPSPPSPPALDIAGPAVGAGGRDPLPAGAPVSERSLSENDRNFVLAARRNGLEIRGTTAVYDILLPTDLLFDFDKATLRPEGHAVLDKVKAHLDAHPYSMLQVFGFTDAKGSDHYNLTLSINRAKAVSDALKAILPGQPFISSGGYGERDPVAPNARPDGSDDPVGRQQNRRVTIHVVGKTPTKELLRQAEAGRAMAEEIRRQTAPAETGRR